MLGMVLTFLVGLLVRAAVSAGGQEKPAKRRKRR